MGTGATAPSPASASIPEFESSANKTSKFKQMVAQIFDSLVAGSAMGEGGNVDVANAGMASPPGMTDALQQTGGNVGEAKALNLRGAGLGAGMTVGAIPVAIAAPAMLGAGLSAAAFSGAAGGIASGALAGTAEGIVGQYGPKETAKLAGEQALFGGLFGAPLGVLGHTLTAASRSAAMQLGKAVGLQSVEDIAEPLGALNWRDHIMEGGRDATKLAEDLRISGEAAHEDIAQHLGHRVELSAKYLNEHPEAKALLAKRLRVPARVNTEDLIGLARPDKVLGTTENLMLYRLAPRTPQEAWAARAASAAKAGKPLAGAAPEEHGFETVAREAYNAALPKRVEAVYTLEELGAARDAARKAVVKEKLVRLDALLGLGADAHEASRMVNVSGLTKAKFEETTLRDVASSIFKKSMLDIGDMMRHSSIWGKAGQQMPDMLDMQSSLTERLFGQWHTVWVEASRGLSATEAEQVSYILEGMEVRGASERVVRAATAFRDILWQHVGDQAESLGGKLVDQDLTYAARKARIALKDLQEFLTDPKKRMVGLTNDQRRVVQLARQANGEVHGETIMIPFRRSEQALPTRYKTDYMKKLFVDGSAEQTAFVDRYLNQHPGGDRDEAVSYLKRHFAPEVDGPFEARGGSLQWSRQNLLDDAMRERDIRAIAPVYLENAARRVAGFHVFGPSDEAFHAMREGLMNDLGHTSPSLAQAAGVPVGKKAPIPEAVRMLDKIWEVSQGRPEPKTIWEDAAGKLVSTYMLSLKTAAVQLSQLANPAAEYGLLNTFKGISGAIMHPEVARMARISGAVASDMRGDIAGEVASGTSRLLNPAPKLIRSTDAFTRAASSMASVLHAEELAAIVQKGGPKAVRAAAELTEKFKLDPVLILQNGGELTDEMLMQASREGSNLTMFASRVQDLPYNRLTWTGRVAGKLSNYSSQQGKFFNARVLAPALKGNFRPLLSSAAMLGLTLPPLQYIFSQLENKKTRGSMTEQLSSLYASSMLGSLSKFLMLWENPSMGAATSVFGPTVGAANNLWTAASDLSHLDFEGAYRAGVPRTWQQIAELARKGGDWAGGQ